MADVLALPFDGIDGSTDIVDVCASPKTVTAYGNARISTAQSKFGGASAYFDGAGDYLNVPINDDFRFGTGDFTIECWVYLNSISVAHQLFDGCGVGGDGGRFAAFAWYIDTNATLKVFANATNIIATSATVPAATWTHVACVRASGVMSLYIGGIQSASVAYTSDNTVGGCSIGAYVNGGMGNWFNGYIDDYRITKGFARYTSNFAPPGAMSGVSAYGSAISCVYSLVPGAASSSVKSYTTLLLHGDGADGSVEIFDNSYYNHDVTVGGNVHISIAESMFADSSLYFDGQAGSYLTLPISSGLQLSGIFTLEAWVRPTAASNGLFGNCTFQTGQGNQWCVANRTSLWTGLAFYYGNLGYNEYARYTQVNLTNNTWQHIAISRDASNVWRLFKNGVLQSVVKWENDGPFNDAIDLTNNTYPITVGNGFTGYMSDLRMLKGLALYTENFTPPGYLPGYVDPNETTRFGIKHTFRPGAAAAVATTWPGFKYGDNTTWSFSCNDPVNSAWATEDRGSPSFPAGAMYLTNGAVNSDTVACFGDTSIFFPTYAVVTLPTGAGDIAAYTDFTFECWINKPSGGGFPWHMAGFPAITCNFVASTWTHFAMCRRGNILRYYKDGQKFYEALQVGAFSILGFGIEAGVNSHNAPFYLESVGFSKSYAHYTANDFVRATIPFYNVPTSQGVRLQLNYLLVPGEAVGSTITPVEADVQWGRTVLLLGGGGTIGSKLIADAKGRMLYNQSDVIYSDAHRKFAQTSLYFNGSSKLVIAPARNLDFIDGDFTIEFWMYPTRIQISSIYSKWDAPRTRSYTLNMTADGRIEFTFYDAAAVTNTTVSSSTGVPLNAFSFVSVCRYGDNYRVWVNGTGGVVVTTTNTPYRFSTKPYNDITTWDSDIIIGANGADGAGPSEYFEGYIEDFRVTNGFARYTTETYALPISGFLKAGSGSDGDPYWADVVMLCHFDEMPGTTIGIRDARGHQLYAHDGGLVAAGGIYGGGWSIGASGVGYLRTPYSADLNLAAGDFTFEVWVNGGPSGGFLAGNSYKQGNRGWQITSAVDPIDPQNESKGGLIQWTQWDSNGVQDIAIGPLFKFFWDQAYGGPKPRKFHVCVMRRGNDLTIFVDGVGSTTSITRRPAYLESDIYLFGYPGSGKYAFGGGDELRWTGAARYLDSGLAVPTGRFPEQPFSYGNAVLAGYYSLVPGQVQAASIVDGTTPAAVYSLVPPLIIGRPSVEGPTVEHTCALLAAEASGGEGFPEDVTFSEVLNTSHAHRHAQAFYMADVAVAQATKGVAVRLGVTDAASAALASVVLTSGVLIGDSKPVTSHAAKALTDDLSLMDSTPVGALGVIVMAAVTVADSAVQAVHQTVLEALGLSAPVLVTSLASDVADAFGISGATGHAAHRTATDGMGMTAALTSTAHLRSSVADIIALSAAPGLDVILYATVSEDVALDDVPAQTLLFQAIVQDHVQFKAFFLSPEHTTWAMNTRNAAVTQYSGFNFNSFARMGKRYLGANDQGLYWLDGDNDAGRAINSRITTGIIQPNGNKLSGVQYAYLGMRGNGQFIVTVTDEAGGSYNYTLTGSSMETARVAFGRGFKTRYFTFALESQGQDFDLDSVEFVTTEITRKVQR